MATSPAALPQELLPALAHVTSALLRKLTASSSSFGATGAATVGAATAAGRSNTSGAAASVAETNDPTPIGSPFDADVLASSSDDIVDDVLDHASSSSPSSSSSSSPAACSVFRDCVQFLQKYPDLVAPTPLFLRQDSPPPPSSLDVQYARWRKLPVLTLSTFAENKRRFPGDDDADDYHGAVYPTTTTATDAFFDDMYSITGNRFASTPTTPNAFVRRALGTYATRLFLDPSNLDRVSFFPRPRLC